MRKKTVRVALGFAMSAVIIANMTGCGQRPPAQTETQAQTETERVTEKTPVTEKASESETQKLITSVDYTSKDGSVKITLPDNTWKVTQDADEMRVFQSGNAAIINIVHANTETAMNNLSVMKSEDELKASLDRQYNTENAYEVSEFTSTVVNGVSIYRYVIKYNAQARMWAWSVTNAIVAADQAYVITGTVTDDNNTLLDSVKKAVESFKVLKDENLKNVTGEIITGTPQQTSETVNTATQSGQEITTLKDYGTTAMLVTTDTVNVRAQPGTDAGILTTLSGNVQVAVIGETANWFKVNINGNTGFIRKDFLVYGKTAATEATETTATPAVGSESGAELNTATNYGAATTLYASGNANIRSAPGTDSSVVGSVAAGTAVTVVGETDNWFIVNIGGATSYISKGLLTTDASIANGQTADQTAQQTQNGGGTPSGKTSVSGTVVGTTVDTLTIQGDDGNTYTVYYGDANTTSADGLYDGVYVSIALDAGQAASDGTLYATNVTGY